MHFNSHFLYGRSSPSVTEYVWKCETLERWLLRIAFHTAKGFTVRKVWNMNSSPFNQRQWVSNMQLAVTEHTNMRLRIRCITERTMVTLYITSTLSFIHGCRWLSQGHLEKNLSKRCHLTCVNRDRSIGIVTGHGLDGRCSISGRDMGFLSSPQGQDWLWGPTSTLSNGYRNGAKRPKREVDYLSSSSAQVKVSRALPPLPRTSWWRGA